MENSEIFKSELNWPTGLLTVFYNSFVDNGNDGRESTLSSKEKLCAMALVVKLTSGVAMKYDLTYGKNLKTDRKYTCCYCKS